MSPRWRDSLAGNATEKTRSVFLAALTTFTIQRGVTSTTTGGLVHTGEPRVRALSSNGFVKETPLSKQSPSLSSLNARAQALSFSPPPYTNEKRALVTSNPCPPVVSFFRPSQLDKVMQIRDRTARCYARVHSVDRIRICQTRSGSYDLSLSVPLTGQMFSPL